MNIKTYYKPVLEQYVMINGISFQIKKLLDSLVKIQITKENDDQESFGYYSLHEDSVKDLDTLEKLVKLDFVKKYQNSIGTNCYCQIDANKIVDLKNELLMIMKDASDEQFYIILEESHRGNDIAFKVHGIYIGENEAKSALIGLFSNDWCGTEPKIGEKYILSFPCEKEDTWTRFQINEIGINTPENK